MGRLARQLLLVSRSAWLDETLVPPPVFPLEHWLAVYLPLIAPLLVPLFFGLFSEVKRYRSKLAARAVDATGNQPVL
jgi:hypothetical protein